jgi:uncharacterized protein (DUF433 family)/predicted nuclease of predicted toxin-antitoxin system
MDYRKIITIEPDKMGGKPCIRGLRITVYDVLDYLASGMAEAEILADFPDLTSEDIRACLAFAADRERRLTSLSAWSFSSLRTFRLFSWSNSRTYLKAQFTSEDVGLKSAADRRVWNYAVDMGFTIVTKDADFRQRSFLFGPPPKVIWIGLGNCSTRQIAELLRKQSSEVEAFGAAEQQAFLRLG